MKLNVPSITSNGILKGKEARVNQPHSIRVIGLKTYLDQTADQHNGFGYDQFHAMVNIQRPPTVASMSRIFGVSKHTMNKWLAIYQEEHQTA
jgi:hypothetical protein